MTPSSPTARHIVSSKTPSPFTNNHLQVENAQDGYMDDAISISSSKRKRSLSLDADSLEVETSSHRAKQLRKVAPKPIKLNENDFQLPYSPLAAEEKAEWPGWVDVESEPLYINTMLRELGVRGVRAEEVLDLESSLGVLPLPTYGLIFCFQYQDSDEFVQGEPCPNDLWFSNQLNGTNACATIALINILLNAKNLELGPSLANFKEDTKDLTPLERAFCLNEHETIRGIHNSFASRIDVWLADRLFASKYRAQQKARNKKLRDEERAAVQAAKRRELVSNPATSNGKTTSVRPKRKATKTINIDDDTPPSSPEQTYDGDSGYHYVAYIPANGRIWRLDGMSWNPQDLGPCSDESMWLFDVSPHIQSRMNEFQLNSGLLFNLMALTKDPASEAQDDLAAKINLLRGIERRLDELSNDWRSLAEDLGEDICLGASEEFGVTQSMIDNASKISIDETDVEKLMLRRAEAAKDQESCKASIRVQKVRDENEDMKVRKARLDLNPMIQRILIDLNEEGFASELLERHRAA